MEYRIAKEVRCPECNSTLNLKVNKREEIIKSGEFFCKSCNIKYIIKNNIPRFVKEDNYANNFGFEWGKYSRLQIDKFSGLDISEKRFWKQTGWNKKNLKNKRVLEAGCGGGRFSQIVIESGAKLYSFDYSNAVDANQENNGLRNDFNLFQADIYKIPFKKEIFDFVFCFGVLQHTPNPERSFKNLTRYLKKGGKIAIDIYPKTLRNLLHPRYFLRPFFKLMSYNQIYWLLKEFWVPLLLPLSEVIRKIPVIGYTLRNAIPVDNWNNIIKINREEAVHWAVLNTFDWFSPKYDRPKSLKEVKKWFYDEKLKDIQVYLNKNIIIATATK